MRIMFIGDISGASGREHIERNLRKLKTEYRAELVVANAENSAHGHGANLEIVKNLELAGIDFFTMGNHTFNKNAQELFDGFSNIVRPANYPPNLPGEGSGIFDTGTFRLGVINVQGRVYMDPIDSPFTAAEKELDKIKDKCDAVIVDFHAEATSEKAALAHYLDGRVAAVLGTHTHVQTADEQILPGGTAFITDVGMTGPQNSILGVETSIIVDRFARLENKKFEMADGKAQFNAVMLDVQDGKTVSIERINIRERI